MSRSAYPKSKLDEYKNKTVSFDGKEIPYYDATQRQRAAERAIRDTKRQLAGIDEAIKDAQREDLQRALQDDFSTASVKLKRQEAALNEFLRQTGLDKDSARMQVAGFGRSQAQKAVWANKKALEKPLKNDIIVTDKQFGKKIGKHAPDFGLDPSKAEDRRKMARIIDDIVLNCSEKVSGNWRGQLLPVDFFIKGEDVVVVKKNGEFVTILKGGIHNARVKDARRGTL